MTKWWMGFLWPWTCHQINLITCLVNPCGCLCQMWGNSLEVLLSYCVHENGTDVWTIGQDGHIMPPAMTTTGTTKDNILTVHHCKKKEKKLRFFPFFHFRFLHLLTLTHSLTEFCISRRVKQVNRRRKLCKLHRSWNSEEKQKKIILWLFSTSAKAGRCDAFKDCL